MQLATATVFAPGPGAPAASPDHVAVAAELGLIAVADAIGPAEPARAAARIALDGVHGHVARNADVLARFRRHPTPALRDRVLAIVDEAFTRAAQETFAFARRHEGVQVALDLVLLLATEAFVGHVGDGRVYLVRRGIVHQLTVDHRQEDEPGRPPSRGAPRQLLRALGPRPSVRVETLTMELAEGDRFVATTRALREHLGDTAIQEVIAASTPAELRGRLLERAPEAAFVAAAAQLGDTTDADGGQQRLARLKPMPLFAHCSESELRQVAQATHPRRFGRGAVLFHQGDAGAELYLLIAGKIRIERDGQHMVTLGPGSNFGEMAMLDEPTRSATAIAESPAELLVIHKEAFFTLMRSNPLLAVKILWNMLLSLSSALRRTSARLAEATDDGRVPRPPTADQPLDAFDLVQDEIATQHDE